MRLRTINEKSNEFEKNEEGHMENLMGGKGEGELCNYIKIWKKQKK